jgi:hypothetical protein
MFDLTSLYVVLLFPLVVAVLVFVTYTYLLKRSREIARFRDRLTRRRFRIFLSLLFAAQLTFTYILLLVASEQYANIPTWYGIVGWMLFFAAVCAMGVYVGITIAVKLYSP